MAVALQVQKGVQGIPAESSFAGTAAASCRGLDAVRYEGAENGTNGTVMDRKEVAPTCLDLPVYMWHAMLCKMAVNSSL